MKRLLILAVLLVAVWAAPAHAGPTSGSVQIGCPVDQTARPVDPLKGYGIEPFGHRHTNVGSRAFGPLMTLPAMLRGATTCEVKSDHSGLWFPTPLKPDGTPATIGAVHYYMRGGSPPVVDPQGLRFIAGDPTCTRQLCARGRMSCVAKGGRHLSESHVIPTSCPAGSVALHLVVDSSFCWNGLNYGPGMGGSDGPADGRSHLGSQFCSTGLRVPQISITLAVGLDVLGGRLSSDEPGASPGSSFHIDYVFAWGKGSDGTLALPKIIDQCFNNPVIANLPAGSYSCERAAIPETPDPSDRRIVQLYGTHATVTD